MDFDLTSFVNELTNHNHLTSYVLGWCSVCRTLIILDRKLSSEIYVPENMKTCFFSSMLNVSFSVNFKNHFESTVSQYSV